MMGSADALPEEPVARPVFVEDMTEEQLASAVSVFHSLALCKPQNKRNNGKFLNTRSCLKVDFETVMSVQHLQLFKETQIYIADPTDSTGKKPGI